jgi:hypothetical protein
MSGKVRSTQAGPTVESADPPRATEGGDDPSEPISREEVFEVLSNERRRLVLRYLRERGEERVDFRDVVDRVAARENGVPAERLDSGDRKCVYSALRQTHLPKLDRLGVVEFDQSRGELTLEDGVEEVFRYMAYSPRRMRRWNRLYFWLAGAACALSIEAGVMPLGSASTGAVGVGIAAAFAVTSLAHLRSMSRGVAERGTDGAVTASDRVSGHLRQAGRRLGAAFGDASARLSGLRPRARSWYVLALESIPGLHPNGTKRNVLLVLLYLIVAAIVAGFVV